MKMLGFALTLGFGAAVQLGQVQAAATAPAETQTATPGPATASTPSPDSFRSELVKMLNAGVSKEIILSYIQSAPLASSPTAADFIALKASGAPDELALAWLKRSSELRQQPLQAEQTLQGEAASRMADPESYAFFQDHYLYPRTLESIYQRLGPYAVPYPYGYPPPPGPWW